MKSRFKLALECPTKLFYTGKPQVYPDAQQQDEFMQVIAEGGFQVGELPKLMFPGGIEATARTHDEQLVQTRFDSIRSPQDSVCAGSPDEPCGDNVAALIRQNVSLPSSTADIHDVLGRPIVQGLKRPAILRSARSLSTTST